jgi:ribosome-associated protein
MHTRILSVLSNKITLQGDLIIKATRFRTQERNKQDALVRLQELLVKASFVPKKRKKTKPSYASSERRLNTKKLHGKNKSLRQSKTRTDG